MSAALRWLLEVAAAWLMPWRAARRIRQQDGDLGALVLAFADVVTGSGKPYERDRVIRRLADALVAQHRQLKALGAVSDLPPEPTRLRVVKYPPGAPAPAGGGSAMSLADHAGHDGAPRGARPRQKGAHHGTADA